MSTPVEPTPTDPGLPRIPELVQRVDLVPLAKRGLLAAIATLGWALWIYLLLPLGALLAWWFGYQRLDIFVLSEPSKTLHTLHLYALIILAGGVLFIFWASYNWLRFHGVDRRAAPKPVDAERIGETFQISTAAVQQAQGAHRLVFHYDDHGNIIDIEATPSVDEPQKTSVAQHTDDGA